MNKKLIFAAVIITSLLISGLFLVIPPGYNTYKYDFKFDQATYTYIGDYVDVDIKGSIACNLVGDPRLPSYTVNFLIPNHRNIKEITVTGNYSCITLQNKVYPQQPDIKCGEDDIPDFVINNYTYSNDSKLINKLYDNEGIQYLKGYPILTLRLYPMDYNPVQNKIYLYNLITVSIEFDDDTAITGNDFLRGDDISDYISNPESIKTYEDIPLTEYPGGLCSPSQSYKYVIITNNDLADNWIPLKNHRITYSGLTSTIVTVEQICGCLDYWNVDSKFNDSAARVREFCKDAYQDWGTEYILLGGNWRNSIVTQQIVPCRMLILPSLSYSYKDMPSDLYFSNLDGTFWCTTQNCWGGDHTNLLDKTTELNVGRICAYNPTTVANAIYKIIWYDNYNNDSWLKTCCFIGSDLGWDVTSKQYMEELRLGTGSFSQYVGFEEFKVVHPDYNLNTLQYRYFDADLEDLWGVQFRENLSKYSIVNHLGHSSWSSPLSLTSWSNYHSTRPFFAWSQGCLAGRYISGEAGCEQLICKYQDSPAFALVLNTGYGWGSSGSTAGKSQHQQKIFWDYFFNVKQNNPEQWQLGKAKTYQNNVYESQTGESYAWYSSNLFGDPAQILKLKATGITVLLVPGHNYLNYQGTTSTTIKSIASSIGLVNGEAVLVRISNIWYAWIVGFTPDEMDKPVNTGDYIDINVAHNYTWVIN